MSSPPQQKAATRRAFCVFRAANPRPNVRVGTSGFAEFTSGFADWTEWMVRIAWISGISAKIKIAPGSHQNQSR